MDELNKLSDEYNVALIYASDHGESLGEKGIFLHAQPYDTAPDYQKDIPMLIWLPQKTLRPPTFGVERPCCVTGRRSIQAVRSTESLWPRCRH